MNRRELEVGIYIGMPAGSSRGLSGIDGPPAERRPLSHAGPEGRGFSLKYTHAVKRRERLTGHELEQFERALEWARWARMGTNGEMPDVGATDADVPEKEKAPR